MDVPASVRSPRISGRYKGYVGAFCCVPGCSNSRGKCQRAGEKISFYRLPKDEKLRKLWLQRIRRDAIDEEGKVVPFTPKLHTRVCSQHFVGGSVSKDPKSIDYVPSIFPRISSVKRQTRSAISAGMKTTTTSSTSVKRKLLLSENNSSGRPKMPRTTDSTGTAVWETTDHDYIKTKSEENCEHSEYLCKLHKLETENEKLKSSRLRLENVKESDEKFQFYTNLPNYGVFSALCDYLKTRVRPTGLSYWRGKDTSISEGVSTRGPERKFSMEEEFFIVLVKLKTGNFNEDLAQTFNTSPAHISRLISTWVNFLSVELKLLFEMQSNDNEKADCYASFEDLKIVVDCTELMCQRSSNLAARKQTFSNYKHHDTVKFLVGLSPSLAVNYVSKAWGGRATDKNITLTSDTLMNNLSPGQSVMADRGFNLSNELKKKGVKLVIPDFKGRDRPQITKNEARRSEYVSKARIHVERIIQRIKTFYHLERIVRLNMQDVVEQIFTVCAYLTNFQLPIIRRK